MAYHEALLAVRHLSPHGQIFHAAGLNFARTTHRKYGMPWGLMPWGKGDLTVTSYSQTVAYRKALLAVRHLSPHGEVFHAAGLDFVKTTESMAYC